MSSSLRKYFLRPYCNTIFQPKNKNIKQITVEDIIKLINVTN